MHGTDGAGGAGWRKVVQMAQDAWCRWRSGANGARRRRRRHTDEIRPRFTPALKHHISFRLPSGFPDSSHLAVEGRAKMDIL